MFQPGRMKVNQWHSKLRHLTKAKNIPISGKKYTVLRLQGEGSLKKVSDPFMVMSKLFLSNGWKEDMQYDADGHGSSSIAYRKETYFCIASVLIDASCDDEETGHVPTKFWFSML